MRLQAKMRQQETSLCFVQSAVRKMRSDECFASPARLTWRLSPGRRAISALERAPSRRRRPPSSRRSSICSGVSLLGRQMGNHCKAWRLKLNNPAVTMCTQYLNQIVDFRRPKLDEEYLRGFVLDYSDTL